MSTIEQRARELVTSCRSAGSDPNFYDFVAFARSERAAALREAAINMSACRAAELTKREAAIRREHPGQPDVVAEMHSDRAQAFHEAEVAICALADAENTTEPAP